MASVYILYSFSADLFYIGCSKDLDIRLEYHQIKEFKSSFTAKYQDWELFFSIDQLNITVARKIEAHIKKMKSKVYISNLKKYPEISKKLIERFS